MTELSIIIPVYNAEQYLDKCLMSIVNQTLQDIEIILVDDGSTDRSLLLCEKYAENDDRIKVFSQRNSGQSKARNVGLDNASAPYIAFVDSDDWVDKDFFEKVLNACKKHDAEIACGSIKRVRKHTFKYRINYTEENVITDYQEKIDAARIPYMCYVWNKVYKKTFIDRLNLRFVEGMFYEDIDFVTRAVYFSNKIVTVPNTYYNYWTNFNSTVKTLMKSDKIRKDSLRSKEMVLEFFKEHNLKTSTKFLVRRKNCIKLFGIPLLKIYEWDAGKKYYLFGIIPVAEELSYA